MEQNTPLDPTSAPRLVGKTVLVTGGAGFIGSAIVDALVADNEVRVLDNLSTGRRANVHNDAVFIEGDVRDRGTLTRAIAGVDVVFHEAAVVSVTASVDDPIGSNDVNLTAFLTLLELARVERARVVVASSSAIYGDPVRVPIAEGHPTDPRSPYGIQKLAVDHYARLYYDLYGLETVVLRYFNVYGPRQHGPYSGVISSFVERGRAGDAVVIDGDGRQTRDFVHVDDVVRANLLAATTRHVGRAYNVGTGEAVTIEELAKSTVALTGGRSRIDYAPSRAGDVRASVADLTLARTEFGFEPSISLVDGLSELVDHGRERTVDA